MSFAFKMMSFNGNAQVAASDLIITGGCAWPNYTRFSQSLSWNRFCSKLNWFGWPYMSVKIV